MVDQLLEDFSVLRFDSLDSGLHNDASEKDRESARQREVEEEVLQACKDTAASFRGSMADRSNRTMILSLVRARPDKHVLHNRLSNTIAADPSLAVCRFDSAGTGVPDGFTPMHVAASLGNIHIVSILIACPSQPSTWVRDLQGRTPLHLAVAYGKVEMCHVLREAMAAERHDPIGLNAPMDLTGSTADG